MYLFKKREDNQNKPWGVFFTKKKKKAVLEVMVKYNKVMCMGQDVKVLKT